MNRSRTRAALTVCALAGLLAAGCGTEPGGARDAPADSAPAADAGEARQEPEKREKTQEEPAAGTDRADGSDSSDGADARSQEEPRDRRVRPPWCATDALRPVLRQLNPAAGNRYTALVLTNTSDTACRTQGYPGLQLVDARGRELPTRVVRDRSVTPEPLLLRPGASAWTRLHWSQVPGDGDSSTGACQGTPAELEVIPPDQRTHTDVRWPSGEVCSGGRIGARPLAAGQGPAN